MVSPRAMLLGPAVWAALALVSPGSAATDDLAALTLGWEVPERCPDEPALRTRVAGYLDEGVPLRELSADVVIRVEQGEWTLRLSFDGRTKELSATTCEDLIEAASVILSLALVPHDAAALQAGEAAPTGPAEASEPPPTGPAEVSEAAPVSPAEAGEAPRPARPSLPPPARVRSVTRVEAGLGFGITPTLTTARIATGAAWARARIELAGTLWTPADGPNLRGDGRRELVTMGSVQAHGCGVLRPGTLSVALCGGLGMGALRVDDIDPTGRQVTHRLWAGGAGSAAVIWRFSRYARLWAGPEAVVGFNRASVSLAESTQVYRTGRVGVRGSIGVELHFPSRPRVRAGNTAR